MHTKPEYGLNHHQISELKSLVEIQLSYDDIAVYEESFLLKSLHKQIHETHCSIADYVKLIAQNPDETIIFLNSLQNSYTEFFRNPRINRREFGYL